MNQREYINNEENQEKKDNTIVLNLRSIIQKINEKKISLKGLDISKNVDVED